MYLPDFFWKYRRSITLLFVLGLLCLVMLDSIHRKWVARAGSELMLGLSFPVQKLSESAYDGGKTSISDLFHTRAENVALRKRVGELEQEMVALKEQISEQRRLDELTGFVNGIESPKLIARVIGTNPPSFSSCICSTFWVEMCSGYSGGQYRLWKTSSGIHVRGKGNTY